jgi:predicted transcriptional regulator
MDFYKVKDHNDLVRDSKTGAILNTNSLDYDKYVAQRSAKSAEHEKTENIEQDLASLKNEINEIKSLLKELVSHG